MMPNLRWGEPHVMGIVQQSDRRLNLTHSTLGAHRLVLVLSPGLHPEQTFLRASFPSPPSLSRALYHSNSLVGNLVPASQTVGCLLKGHELPSASSLTCAHWPCEEAPNLLTRLTAVPGQGCPHLVCVIPDFSWDSNMESPTMHLGAGLGRSFY
jgi:hypothetical protein